MRLRLDAKRRADYAEALNRINGLLVQATGEPVLDKERTLRLVGSGMSLLLGLAVEALGGDSEAIEPSEGARAESDATNPGGT